MSDLISRQAAIDALKNDMASLDHIIKGMSANDVRLDAYVQQRNQVNYDIYTINNLPPAQPERTCVNCGRTANNGGWYADGRTRCPIEEHYALPKDGYCHLWEKRNFTDDDYPERREE